MADATNIHKWIYDLRDSVPEQIHPSAQCICHEYLNEMHMAADAADMDELKRLLALVQNKIAFELAWEHEHG